MSELASHILFCVFCLNADPMNLSCGDLIAGFACDLIALLIQLNTVLGMKEKLVQLRVHFHRSVASVHFHHSLYPFSDAPG